MAREHFFKSDREGLKRAVKYFNAIFGFDAKEVVGREVKYLEREVKGRRTEELTICSTEKSILADLYICRRKL